MLRRFRALVAALAPVAATTSPVLADDVSANCTSSGGIFSTSGYARGWQDHWHDGLLWQVFYDNVMRWKTHSWGFETGIETGEVYGGWLSAASARCII